MCVATKRGKMVLQRVSGSVLLAVIMGVLAPVQAQATQGVGGQPHDVAFFVGAGRSVRLDSVFRLSDGTLLIGGGGADLAWVPSAVPRVTLKGTTSAGSGSVAFLLHCSGDLKTLLRVVCLPQGMSESVSRIRDTSLPGEKTGVLFLSGGRSGGYMIGRLDGNFVDRLPTGFAWTREVAAGGILADLQPWDVSSDGTTVYATGTPHGHDWMSVQRLKADGRDDVVPHWRTHWTHDAGGTVTEFYGDAAASPVPVTRSAIVLKIGARGDFRSWNREDFVLKSSDGNGGVKEGRWPFDAMMKGYWDPATHETVDVTGTGKGYTGYRWGKNPCASVGAIAVDRRTGTMYLGGNNQSKLPDGKPDFEPWVVAMDKDGSLRWWQRLYAESKGVSTPDQFVDGLAIDYGKAATGGTLVVVARSHGNNVNNYYNASKLVHPVKAFQDGFTGRMGNIHYSWIGRLSQDRGDVVACTYLAEYADGTKHGRDPFSEPNLKHWPAFTSGWPDLNTTRMAPGSLVVDPDGSIGLCATGRRVVTTRNAFLEMPSPQEFPESKGQWSDFVRVYRNDLSGVKYSSLLKGPWDWTTGTGGSDVSLRACIPVPSGVIVVGTCPENGEGKASGDPMPVRNVPTWGNSQRAGRTGVIAYLHFP